jgi:hypothetical protein
VLRQSLPRATFRGAVRCVVRKISRSHLTICQTFGNNFESDGRLRGTPSVQTVNCDTQANTCQVKVPATSFALVFFSDAALISVSSATLTFPTTAVTRTRNTVYIDPSLLANSNGDYGFQNKKGSTSLSSNACSLRPGKVLSGLIAPACVVAVFQFLTHLWQ